MPHAPDAVIIIQYGRLQSALSRLAGVAEAASIAARTAWDAVEELDKPRPNGQPPEYPWDVLGPVCEKAEARAAHVEKIAADIVALHDAIIKDTRDLSYAALNRAKPG